MLKIRATLSCPAEFQKIKISNKKKKFISIYLEFYLEMKVQAPQKKRLIVQLIPLELHQIVRIFLFRQKLLLDRRPERLNTQHLQKWFPSRVILRICFF